MRNLNQNISHSCGLIIHSSIHPSINTFLKPYIVVILQFFLWASSIDPWLWGKIYHGCHNFQPHISGWTSSWTFLPDDWFLIYLVIYSSNATVYSFHKEFDAITCCPWIHTGNGKVISFVIRVCWCHLFPLATNRF